jgi:filamentous hemagglutinin family protein
MALTSGPSHAQTILPTNGVVTSGAASIRQSGADLSVTQSSSRAIVNWRGFSIGQGDSVTFDQPNASSAILNRVTGSTTSSIAGQLRANGQVYLVNPNGIAITPTGAVRVGGGFVASTLGISDDDFSHGNLRFTGDGASAGVANAGSIQAAPGGFVGLLGGTVSNSGVVAVPLGKVAMGSGELATLNLTGDNFLQVSLPTNTKTADGQALIDVSGKVRAAGGSVQLKAATVAKAIREAVNVPGELSVASARASGGSIILSGGDRGDVSVTGRLNASGRSKGGTLAIDGRNVSLRKARLAAQAANGAGGAVTVTGTGAVSLTSTSIDASGATGGGAIRIGGEKKAQASSVSLDSATAVRADATVRGNGGSISVWSTGSATIRGAASAKGGVQGGDGGAIETSGAALDFAGASVDASSAHGRAGTWLLDPANLTIDQAAATAIDTTLAAGTTGTNVVEQTNGAAGAGAGDINVDAPISWSTGATLTLSAFHSIVFNAPTTIAGAGQLVLTTNNNVGGTSTGDGALAFTKGQGSAQFTGGPSVGAGLTINGQPYALVYTMAALATEMNRNTSGNFALAAPIDASSPLAFPAAPVATFSGKFEGLGNTISNLTIDVPAGTVPQGVSPNIGLIGLLNPAATIENIGLVGGSVTNNSTHTVSNPVGEANASVGELVGFNNGGTIANAYATGAVNGGGETQSNVGGLVGGMGALFNGPAIAGAIINSYATGTVTGSGTIGGLVGSSGAGSTITGSHATGAVISSDSGSGEAIGGLVGFNYGGSTIASAYANGRVAGGAGADIGGLVGANFISTITDAYATGAVSGGKGANVGGLIGLAGGTITDVYATGAVSGAGASLGGLIGTNFGGTFADAYWDTGTTGQSSSAGGVGLTTAQLQAALPAFQNPQNWGIVAGKSYPYLCIEFAGCAVTPQTVSGVVFSDSAGVSPVGAGTPVNGLVNGVALNSLQTGGGVTTGANGYYYFLLAPGSIPANGAVLTFTIITTQPTLAAALDPNGAALVDQIAAGSASNADIYANTLHIITPAVAYSTAAADLATAIGSSPVGPFVASLPNLTIDASSAFTIDQAISHPTGVITATALGDLTIGAGGSLAANSVTLATKANFFNQAGAGAISLQGSGGRWLVYSTNPNLDVDGGLAPNFFQYNAPYTIGADSGTTPAAPGNGFLYSDAPAIAITGVTRTYDATAALPTAAADYAFSGVNSGDSVSLDASGAAGSYATPNAGTGIDVTMTTLPTFVATRGGVPVFGYGVAPVSNDPIGTIAPLALTYSVADAASTYGATATLGAARLSGVLPGQTVVPTVGAFSGTTQVAISPRTPAGLYIQEVTGLSNPNYTIAPSGNAPGTLTVDPLTVTYSVANASSTFGTTPIPGATTLFGALPGDVLVPTVGLFKGPLQVPLSPLTPVGQYLQRVTALSNPNYRLGPSPNFPGVLTITARSDPGFLPGLTQINNPSPGGYDLGAAGELLRNFTSCEEPPSLPDPNRFADSDAALRAISQALENYFRRCQNPTQTTISDALDEYAAKLQILAPRLPPALRNIPAIVADGARRVRAARSRTEAVAVLRQTVAAVHKEIALVLSEDPETRSRELRDGDVVAAALDRTSVALVNSGGL